MVYPYRPYLTLLSTGRTYLFPFTYLCPLVISLGHQAGGLPLPLVLSVVRHDLVPARYSGMPGLSGRTILKMARLAVLALQFSHSKCRTGFALCCLYGLL